MSGETNKPDHLVEALERQQRSAALLGAFEDQVFSLEADIIKSLVAQYNVGSLTDIQMRGAVGGIAALRTLLKRIDRELETSQSEVQHNRV